jgi:glycogen operon protein
MRLFRRSVPVLAFVVGGAAACGSDAVKEAPGGLDAGGDITDASRPDGAVDSGVTAQGDAATDAALDGGSTDPGPFPLGATWGTQAVHFRVMADPATALELELYTTTMGAGQVLKVAMTRAGGAGTPWAADVPHAQLATVGITSVVYYGYRAWGPNWTHDPSWTEGSSAGYVADVDGAGNRFDPNKLLIDPYAREISHDPLQPGSLSSTPYSTGTARTTDDGPLAPKSIVVAPDTMGTGTAPTRALKDDIIYEVNVRGLTMSDTTVPAAQQGTYAGAATKAAALAALGVTVIELLPIHETQNDQNDADPSGANYWGYSTLAFFAPDRRYASDKTPGGPTREFKAMVAAFHAQGIKVFLDVVYNHTAEGGPSTANVGVAKLLSWRGLDNPGYYELAADHASAVDDTGVGGNFNAASTVVRNLVIDSLTYWHGSMGVDGFRFDVAPVLGNTCASVCYTFSNSDPAGILQRALTSLTGVPLIAEPWGTGNGTYQLGNFPTGWSEWNGEFRDEMRAAQNELGTVATAPSTIADRVTGSPDIFNHDARAPWASINYVDCHDGFTLHDEYAYDAPDNTQAYPYGPSSGGSTTNNSWDQGGVLAAQQQAARTGLALVLLASGVPMFQGGDEMLRTQYGNNNAYNLDDSAMWLDPTLATTNAAFVAWTHALIAFRTAHTALRPAAFLDGQDHNGNGLPDVGFLDTTAAAASAAYLADTTNHFLAWRLDGSEAGDTARSIYVAYNGWSGDLPATVPSPASATTSWWVSGDSASGTFAAPGAETALGGTSITVKARSVAVLVER